MARFRKRPINSYFQSVMDDNGWKTLADVAKAKGIPVERLTEIADIDESHKTINSHLNVARALDIPIDEWLNGLVGRNVEEKEAS